LIRCVKNTEFQKQWIRYIKCRQEYGEANDTKWVPLRDNICKILISNLKVTEDRNPNEEMRKSHFRLNDLPDFMERFSDN